MKSNEQRRHVEKRGEAIRARQHDRTSGGRREQRVIKAFIWSVVMLPLTAFAYYVNFLLTCIALHENYPRYSLEKNMRIAIWSSAAIAGFVFVLILIKIVGLIREDPNSGE